MPCNPRRIGAWHRNHRWTVRTSRSGGRIARCRLGPACARLGSGSAVEAAPGSLLDPAFLIGQVLPRLECRYRERHLLVQPADEPAREDHFPRASDHPWLDPRGRQQGPIARPTCVIASMEGARPQAAAVDCITAQLPSPPSPLPPAAGEGRSDDRRSRHVPRSKRLSRVQGWSAGGCFFRTNVGDVICAELANTTPRPDRFMLG
jgi:hypothetical protein